MSTEELEQASLFAGAPVQDDTGLNWNKQQRRIFDWTRRAARDRAKSRHAQIRARAGTGKTTTAVEMASIISDKAPGADALFVSFSSSIAEELSERLEGTDFDARTVHSVGFEVVRNRVDVDAWDFTLNDWKYLDLIDDWARENYRDYRTEGWYETKWDIYKVLDYLRSTLIDPTDEDALKEAANARSVALGSWAEGLPDILEMGHEKVRKLGEVSFKDMTYFPIAEGLRFPTYDWLLIDEAQDLNPAQKKVVEKLVPPDGNTVWIGDEHQAIFMFQGADPSQFLAIPEEWGAEVFDLPVTYRCPKRHVREAKRLVSDIEAPEDAEEGRIETSEEKDFFSKVRPGDYVIARRNAPLISKAIDLLKRQRPAYVEGKKLDKRLNTIVDSVVDMMVENSDFEEGGRQRLNQEDFSGMNHRKKDYVVNYENFGRYLEEWERQKVESLIEQGAGEKAVGEVLDKKSCIESCYNGFEEATSPAELKDRISSLVVSEEDAGEGVALLTIHKSKGREFERLHIIDTSNLPLEFDDVVPVGELNVKYVALTRSSGYLNVFGELWGEREGVSIGDPLEGEEFEVATEELKQKIVQLLRKANSTRFEPEAEAFRTKAEELLAEFDLTREDLRADGFTLG